MLFYFNLILILIKIDWLLGCAWCVFVCWWFYLCLCLLCFDDLGLSGVASD